MSNKTFGYLGTSSSNYSPIIVFVYNRPIHTQQTIEALQQNRFAENSNLIIYSDAPKTESYRDSVNDVRRYIRQITGFKSVSIIEREKNYGLAASIIDGVTSVVNKCGKVIVLEDDLVVSPYFLAYMNNALNIYENTERVLHISGYMFPVENPGKLPQTFFYRAASCWGWATWKRAWKYFEADSAVLLEIISKRRLASEFDILGTSTFTQMLKKQSLGHIDSWAIRWYASVFIKNGLCLHPSQSLVNNIGHDGSGVHCVSNEAFEVDISGQEGVIIDEMQPLEESQEALLAIMQFNKSLNKPLLLRIYSGLDRRIKNLLGSN